MTDVQLKLGDEFTDVYGTWEVIQIAPPLGRRRFRYITILNKDTHQAEQVPEQELVSKDNKLVKQE